MSERISPLYPRQCENFRRNRRLAITKMIIPTILPLLTLLRISYCNFFRSLSRNRMPLWASAFCACGVDSPGLKYCCIHILYTRDTGCFSNTRPFPKKRHSDRTRCVQLAKVAIWSPLQTPSDTNSDGGVQKSLCSL